MRIALLTDLHANREALDACLAHAAQQGPDLYAFLGDLVGYGADPCYVTDTVMEHVARGAIAVQGNHDLAATRPVRYQGDAETREVLEWTQGRLSAEQTDFLRALPLTVERDELLFVHASAHLPAQWEYVSDVEQAERSLAACTQRLVFSGHMHQSALYRQSPDGSMGSHRPVAGVTLPLPPLHRYLVIPGSAGQPRDGNCAAGYALYDAGARTLTFHRIPYDHGAAARRIMAEQLPMVFAMRLIEGI